jgi:NADH-quinone oxidoreductase subunit M
METSLLTWIIFTPIIFGLLIALMPSSMEHMFRKVALVQSLVNVVLAIGLYANFDGGFAGAQFMHMVPWLPEWGINYFVSIDGISLPLVMLTAFVGPVAILGTWPKVGPGYGELKKEKFFVLSIIFMKKIYTGEYLK